MTIDKCRPPFYWEWPDPTLVEPHENEVMLANDINHGMRIVSLRYRWQDPQQSSGGPMTSSGLGMTASSKTSTLL